MFIESGFDGTFGTYSGIPPMPPVAAPVTEEAPVRGIYRLNIDCGRSGSLDGIFSATDEYIKSIIGRSFSADEPLGKHSFVSGNFEEDEFVLVTQDPAAVAMFDKYNLESGWTPYNLIDEDDDE